MCGICGFVLRREGAAGDPERTIRAMAAALRHRGPDGASRWSQGPVFFGHTRLAVIDRAGGAQPMVSEATGCVLTYNGEIYNYRDLRRALEQTGRRFQTDSDTEVVLQAYEEYGAACVERFNGMFAFAIWDPRRQKLFLARDRVGKKPLYYVATPSLFAFASEPKALLRIPVVADSASIDPQALSDVLSLGYVLAPKSIYRGMRRLPAAARAWVPATGGPPAIEDYWPVRECYRKTGKTSLGEQMAAFGGLLDDAVSIRLHADVPVGIYLSGGIDSAAVALAAARTAARPPKAFCVTFEERSFDESAAAEQTARHLGLEIELVAAAAGPRAARELVAVTDEPFADASLMPSLALNNAARRHITVALSGDGADELFAGYPTYLADRLYAGYRHVPGALQRAAAAGAAALLRPSYRKASLGYGIRQFLSARGLDPRRAHYHWRTIFSEAEKRRLMHPDLLAACGGYDPYDAFAARFDEVAGADFLSQCLYVDLKTWLADDILVKVDRASMAHGLEVRSPFLDYRLVEFAAALPPSSKFGWLRRKRLMRAYLKGKLPGRIVAGGKRGFNAPTQDIGATQPIEAAAAGWLRGDFRVDAAREDITFKRLVLGVLNALAASARPAASGSGSDGS